MIGWISLVFFMAIILIGYRTKPSAIPVAILYVKGIIMIVIKLGMTMAKLLQLILLISVAINAPTMIRAGAVTSGVTIDSTGEKNKEIIKHAEMTMEVKPVRPPAAIPEDDSTIEAVVDVPSTAPITVDIESARSAFPPLGIWLFFIKPAWLAMAMSAPAVSKKATNKKVKITTSTFGEKMSSKFSKTTPKEGFRLGIFPMMA